MSKLWKPSKETIQNTQMFKFMQYLNAIHHTEFNQYQDLYRWSVENLADFWIAVWNFCEIKANKLWEQPLLSTGKMWNTKWFTESTLNFAENILSRNDDKIAIIFQNEKQQRKTYTFKELNSAVHTVATALKIAGVKTNDRVAGYLPNIPESVIVMLAANSLGAIWSCCAPDFGTSAVIERFKQIAPKILFAVDGYSYQGKELDVTDKIKNIAAEIPSLEKTIVIPYLNKIYQSDNNLISYDQFIQTTSEEPFEFQSMPFDHPAFILYSSGTTGVPKCIVHSAGGTLIQLLKELKLHTNITDNDIVFYYTSPAWMMWNWFTTSLALGATIVLYDGAPFFPKKSHLFDLIDQEKISVFGTSANYISLCEKSHLVPKQTHQLTSLKTILSTGSPLLPENFDYVYEQIKPDVHLASISGGTDIISCFALGNPMLPVYRGELQSIGLGMKVKIFNEQGQEIFDEKGELVCTAAFPSMPIYFWNDADGKKYHAAYFEKFYNVWAHGDFAKITPHHGMVIYGRSDATLKSAGVRIGTAEIYNVLQNFEEIEECLATTRTHKNESKILLFIKLTNDSKLTDELINTIKQTLRDKLSPHHVPAEIYAISGIPKTFTNKIAEIAVRNIVNGEQVENLSAIANPEALREIQRVIALNKN